MRRIVSFHVQCEKTQAEEYINKMFLVNKNNLQKIMSKIKLRKKKRKQANEIDS